MKIVVNNFFESGWMLFVTTHPDSAQGVKTPLGWTRSDNESSGIRRRWRTIFSFSISSPLVETGSYWPDKAKKDIESSGSHEEFELEKNGGRKSGDVFAPIIRLPGEILQQLLQVVSEIEESQTRVDEAAGVAVLKLFDPYTAKEFGSTPEAENICGVLVAAGYRPWAKRYRFGRHIVAFAGPDGLVKAPKDLIPHLIGKGGETARVVLRVTGATKIIAGD